MKGKQYLNASKVCTNFRPFGRVVYSLSGIFAPLSCSKNNTQNFHKYRRGHSQHPYKTDGSYAYSSSACASSSSHIAEAKASS